MGAQFRLEEMCFWFLVFDFCEVPALVLYSVVFSFFGVLICKNDLDS